MTTSSIYVILGDSVSQIVTCRTAGSGTIRCIKKEVFAAAKAKGKP